VLTVGNDAGRVERMLEEGSLCCPVCGGRLAGWGHALERVVFEPVGFQNLATGVGLGFYGSLVFVDEAAEDVPALDLLLGEVGDGVVGPGRAELAAAMGSPPVVVGLVPGQDRPQVPLAEDQHPVGDLRPGGAHESFRIGVVPHRQLHLIRSIGTDVSG